MAAPEKNTTDNSPLILVAEDNILNQRLLSFLLTQSGFRNKVCNNGKEAVDFLAKESFNLVLMDIEMPEMNGYEASEYIRKKLGLRIPIIAVSAHETDKEKQKCFEAGMNDYITKPVKTDELLAKMQLLLGSVKNQK